ncbi:MAG TPA: hypothetical protein VI603_14880 [Saprospiraceae bacterium]|nr:hypothetical protein [Saprospiraceae bacterium]
MPPAEEILAVLRKSSNDLILVAIIFHVLVLLFAISLFRRWRPEKRIAGILLSIPLLSVSLIAWMYGNPFNGLVFAIFFVLLILFAVKLPREPIDIAEKVWIVPAVLLIAFGLFYPHFLEAHPAMYLVAAPAGVIPCPTLSIVIGFTILFRHFNSKRWTVTLAAIGLFYGVFGLEKLHVNMDVILLIGSLLLLMRVFSISHRDAKPWKKQFSVSHRDTETTAKPN